MSGETVVRLSEGDMMPDFTFDTPFAAGYKHGACEGNELQLPAAFVVDKERCISYAHYGKSAGDTPDVRSLAELLK